MDTARVIQVWAGGGAQKAMVGSGYLVRDGLVLTAGHVTDRGAEGSCKLRAMGEEKWLDGAVVWRGGETCDASLLRFEGGAQAGADVGFARFATNGRAACEAAGFPRAQRTEDERPGAIWDIEHLAGEVDPLSGRKDGVLTIHVAGSVPEDAGPQKTYWAGMSGAAVFSGPVVVGVVAGDPKYFGPDRLEAVPMATMAADPRFREQLTGDPAAELVLPAVEDLEATRGLLKQPYRPLPPHASIESLRRRAPSRLLRSEAEVVPFRGRAAKLDALGRWCDGEPGLAVSLMTGPGGTGKTRLAAELCRRRQQLGAMAGFFEEGADPGRLSSVSSPLLVLVDEAQSRVDEVAGLLKALAATPPPAPARVLMLARQAGEWWDERLPERVQDDADASLALELHELHELDPVDLSTEARAESFRAAVEAFGGSPDVAQPDLSQPLFEQILFVHLAALSSIEGQTELLSGEVLRADLLEFALGREELSWPDNARAAGLDFQSRVLKRAVAVATLMTAETEAEAQAALRAIPDLVDAPASELLEVAYWLRDLYPVPPGRAGLFRPLIPDLLGESLVAAVLQDVPALALDLLANASSSQAKRVLTVLTRAARVHAGAEASLRGALGKRLTALWRLAIEVAQEVGDPIGRFLAEALDKVADPALTVEVRSAVPDRTVALRELAVVAVRQELEHTLRTDPGPDRDAHAAELQNDLSAVLANLGRREEALAAIGDAVAGYRRLEKARPGELTSELGLALTNTSFMLHAAGRPDEALAASEEALDLFRRNQEGKPIASSPNLATACRSQAAALWALGRTEEALAAADEAVKMHRSFVAAAPDTFLPELGGSLTDQLALLRAMGRPEDALAAADEASEVFRRLAEAHPDAFLPELANSLANRSAVLSGLGRPEEALAAGEEAVESWRRLAEARPEAFLEQLAMALVNVAAACLGLGRPEAALAALEEAVSDYRGLEDRHPGAFTPQLATALANHSFAMTGVGRLDEAEVAVDEAIALRRRLAKARPGAFVPDLAMSLTLRSTVLSTLGRTEEALAAIEESVALYRPLAGARPDVYLSQLATALDRRSLALVNVGRAEDGLADATEAVETYRRLARELPDVYLPSVGMALNNRAVALSRLERVHESLETLDEAIAVYEPLAAVRPDAFQPVLSLLHVNRAAEAAGLDPSDASVVALEEAVKQQAALMRGVRIVPPDASNLLVGRYRGLCQRLGREPDPRTIEAMAAMTVGSG